MAKPSQYTVVEHTGILRSDGVLCLDEEAITMDLQALQRDGWEIVSTGMESRAQGSPWQPSHLLHVTYDLQRP